MRLHDPCSEVFIGPEAFSEPETKAGDVGSFILDYFGRIDWKVFRDPCELNDDFRLESDLV